MTRLFTGRNAAVHALNHANGQVELANQTIERLEAELLQLKARLQRPSLLTLDMLHPGIQQRSSKLFRECNFGEAIFNACKAVESHLRDRVNAGPEVYGVNLVAHATRQPEPYLTFSAIDTENQGVQLMLRGLMMRFRNEHGHRFPDVTENEALQLLHTASILMRQIDDATLVS